MPRWYHRPTKDTLISVASADLPNLQSEYIEEPDYSAVEGEPKKYWDSAVDTIFLISQADRDDLDADEEDARKDALEAEFLDDPSEETTRDLINVERATRGASPISAAEHSANYRSNL